MTTSVSGQKDLGPRENLVGQKFGRLTVIELAGKNHRSQYKWKTICECEKETIVFQAHLKNGHTVSCGCYNNECREKRKRKYSKEDSVIRNFFKRYKGSAKSRGIDFNLSFSEFKKIGSGLCFYCGASPILKDTNDIKNTIPSLFNGIDRIDNSLGYFANNCVSCCSICNSMKNSLSVSEFKEHMFRLCINNIKEFEIYKEGV